MRSRRYGFRFHCSSVAYRRWVAQKEQASNMPGSTAIGEKTVRSFYWVRLEGLARRVAAGVPKVAFPGREGRERVRVLRKVE